MIDDMTCVVLESPYAGDIEKHTRYAQLAMQDCLLNYNEAPYASHLLYAHELVLDDSKPEERSFGIGAGLNWCRKAAYIVAYTDLSISPGMQFGIQYAENLGMEVKYRTLPADLLERL